jgi:hypothetical protein
MSRGQDVLSYLENAMNKPILTKGVTSITLGEHPSDWSVVPIVGDNTQTSLYGKDFVDVIIENTNMF